MKLRAITAAFASQPSRTLVPELVSTFPAFHGREGEQVRNSPSGRPVRLSQFLPPSHPTDWRGRHGAPPFFPQTGEKGILGMDRPLGMVIHL